MSSLTLVFPPLVVPAPNPGAACYANQRALEAFAALRAQGRDVRLVDALALPDSSVKQLPSGEWFVGAPEASVRAAIGDGDVLVWPSDGAVDLELPSAKPAGELPSAFAVHPNLARYWAFLDRAEQAFGPRPGDVIVASGVLPCSARHADVALEAAVRVSAKTLLWIDDGTQAGALGPVSERARAAGVFLEALFPIGRAGESKVDANATLARALAIHEGTGAWPTITLAPHLPAAELAPFKWTFDRRVEAGQGPAKVILNATYRCNNRCTFCATGTRTQFDGNFERQQEILRKYRQHGVTLLDIDGGEPTLNPNLCELVQYARELGYEKVNVTTNGRMASYEGFAKQLVHCGVTSILFSIHGHTAQVHAQNVGVAEAFDQTLAGVRNVVRLAPPTVELGANVTITKSNHRVLPEMAQLVWDLGLRWWNLQFLTPFGRATRATCPDTQTAADIAMRVIDQWRDRLKFQVINLPFCFMPGYEEFLVGDLLKLERHMIFVNNDEVNLFEYLRERRTKKPVCETCPRAVFCGGFYELDNVPEPTWLVTPEDLVKPIVPELPLTKLGLGAR